MRFAVPAVLALALSAQAWAGISMPQGLGGSGIGTSSEAVVQVGPYLPLTFPRYPGLAGASLPSVNCMTGVFDFDRIDYQGWGTGSNTRMTWATDPIGTRVCAKLVLQDNDVATQLGGQRAELWQSSEVHTNGSEAWFAFGYLLGSTTLVGASNSFKCPSTKACIWSNGGTTTDHPQSIEFSGCTAITSQGNFTMVVRQTPGSAGTAYTIDPATRDVWHYFLVYVSFRTTATGQVKVWHAVGQRPDVFATPQVNVSNVITLYTPTGYPKVGLNRVDAGSTEYPWGAYLWGYGRGTDALGAMSNAGFPQALLILRPTVPAALGDQLFYNYVSKPNCTFGCLIQPDSSYAIYATSIDDFPGDALIDSVRFNAVAWVPEIFDLGASYDTTGTLDRRPNTQFGWKVGTDSSNVLAISGDPTIGRGVSQPGNMPNVGYVLGIDADDMESNDIAPASKLFHSPSVTTAPDGGVWTRVNLSALTNVKLKTFYNNGYGVYNELRVSEMWVEVFYR